MEAQNVIWDWFDPYIETILRDNLKSETLHVWLSFLEVLTPSFYLSNHQLTSPPLSPSTCSPTVILAVSSPWSYS
jgi:hypothetical protein